MLTSRNLSEHPLSGKRVRVTLVARDAAGEEGRSEPPAEGPPLQVAAVLVLTVEGIVADRCAEIPQREQQRPPIDRVVVDHAADVEEDDVDGGPVVLAHPRPAATSRTSNCRGSVVSDPSRMGS